MSVREENIDECDFEIRNQNEWDKKAGGADLLIHAFLLAKLTVVSLNFLGGRKGAFISLTVPCRLPLVKNLSMLNAAFFSFFPSLPLSSPHGWDKRFLEYRIPSSASDKPFETEH